jgi:hypothetical protein
MQPTKDGLVARLTALSPQVAAAKAAAEQWRRSLGLDDTATDAEWADGVPQARKGGPGGV